ncbi:MAG: hypothetical protein E6J97_02795, partial [Methanobacteriota archaeon]
RIPTIRTEDYLANRCLGGARLHGLSDPRHLVHGPAQHLVLGLRAHRPPFGGPIPGQGRDRDAPRWPVRRLQPRARTVGEDVWRPLERFRPHVLRGRVQPTSDADERGRDARFVGRLQFVQGPDQGWRYLRRLREAWCLEGRGIHSRAVQAEVAKESNLKVDAFVQALDDGTANEAFQRDRDECQTLGISGFPTFVIRRDDETRHVDGWRPWDAFEEILRDVDPHLEAAPIKANEETALNLIQRYGMLATTELAAVLGTTDDDAEILLEELEGRDDVIRRPVGRGLMWELPTHRVGTPKADVTSRSS